MFTVAQSNPSTQDTSIVVTLDLGTVEAADITSISYVDASGATVTTTIAALQAGLALTIPATPDGSAPWSPVFTITAAQDAIYEVSEALTMNLALGAGETDATLGTAVATGTILDESSTLASDITGGNNLGDKPVVSITATDATAVEGTTNNTLVFTVSQTNLSTVDTTVLVKGTLGDISVADLTSISYTNAAGTVVTLSTPTDIASFFSTGVTVKIPAGLTAAPVITFTASNDTIFEQSESFSVVISAPVNAVLGSLVTQSATGTIFDPFVDANETTTTFEDTPISGNVIDAGLGSSGQIIALTTFEVVGDSTIYAAGQSANIAGVGSITIDANGTYTFIPATNFHGVVPTVTYSLTDDAGATVGDTSTLTITVTPVNDPPVDPNDTNTVIKDTTLTVAANAGLLVGATDVEGDTLTITGYTVAGIAGTPTMGSPFAIPGVGALTINADGSYSFTPEIDYTGPIPVATYTISDGNGGTDTSTLTLTIGQVNDVDDVEVASIVSRLIPTAHYIQKPFEHPPLKMGYYEFNTVVLDFNGAYGGINQFSLPHGETTMRRGALQYSNHTPYIEFDRVGDELQNAQRTINTNEILSSPSNEGLSNPVLPADAQLDFGDTEISIPPPNTLVGGQEDKKFTAYTKNGKLLPDWVKFNRVNGNFETFSSDEAMEPVEIQVIGTDAKDNQAETKPNSKPPVKAVPKTAFVGKESLTSQIKSALTFGKG